MFRGFVADCKAYLQDRPSNIVAVIFAALVILFFNVWGLITCGFLYVIAEEPEIYRLLPETENERQKRRIFNAGMELLLIVVLATLNLLIMHGYNQSVLLQFPNLFLLDAAYCIYLFYHRICKFSQTQNKMWSEKQESNRVYEGIVFIADKILIITLVLCALILYNDYREPLIAPKPIVYVLIQVGLGIGFAVLLVDVIRQIGGRKYED